MNLFSTDLEKHAPLKEKFLRGNKNYAKLYTIKVD